MKLSLASIKVHLAHCTLNRGIGRAIGLIFTLSGTPNLASLPSHH